MKYFQLKMSWILISMLSCANNNLIISVLLKHEAAIKAVLFKCLG